MLSSKNVLKKALPALYFELTLTFVFKGSTSLSKFHPKPCPSKYQPTSDPTTFNT